MKNKTLSAHALFKGYMLCQKKCVTNRPDSRTKWPLRTWSRDFVPNINCDFRYTNTALYQAVVTQYHEASYLPTLRHAYC